MLPIALQQNGSNSSDASSTPPSANAETTAAGSDAPVLSDRQNAAWDIRNAPKNYISLVAAHGATAFFSFASVWLITRKIGSEGYGVIVAFVAASQLVQIFLNWSSTALARFGIEEFVETGKITRSFWSRTLLFFPNLLVLLALAVFWLRPVANWLKIPEAAVWLIAVHLAVTAIWLHVQYGLQGVKMLRLQGVLLAVERGFTFIGLLAIVLFGQMTLISALWCYIVPALILTVLGLVILRPFVALEGFFDRDHFRKMLVYSLPLIPFAVVGYLSTSQLDAFFITKYLSTRELGIYAVAAQINGLLLQLPILANAVLLSMFVSLKTRGDESLISRFIKDAVPSITLGWSAICVGVSALCIFLIPAIFGAEFRDSSIVLWILTTATACSFPVLMGFATLSNAYSKTYISMYASIGTASVNVLFNLLLIPSFGIIGCAWATVLSAFVGLVIFYLLLRKSELVPASWVLISISPAALSALCASGGFGELAALLAFVLLGAILAYFHSDSIIYALRVIKGRFNVKNVSPEPILR